MQLEGVQPVSDTAPIRLLKWRAEPASRQPVRVDDVRFFETFHPTLMNLFELLHESHDRQRALARQLTVARASAATREAVFLQLKVELEAHAAAEERFLYVPLLMTDGGLSASRHALSEHHQIEELCEDLSVADKSGDEWLATAKELAHKVRHHLKEEENKFFKVAGRLLSDSQKALLARRYQKDLVRMRKKGAGEFATVAVDAAGTIGLVKTSKT